APKVITVPVELPDGVSREKIFGESKGKVHLQASNDAATRSLGRIAGALMGGKAAKDEEADYFSPYNGPASLAPQPIAAGGYGGAANFAMRGGSFAPPPPAMPSAGQVFQQKQFEVSERRQSGVKEYNKRSEYNKQSAADKKADKTVSKLSAQLQSL